MSLLSGKLEAMSKSSSKSTVQGQIKAHYDNLSGIYDNSVQRQETDALLINAATKTTAEIESARLMALGEALKSSAIARNPELTRLILAELGVKVPANASSSS